MILTLQGRENISRELYDLECFFLCIFFQDLQRAQMARDKLSSPLNVLKIIRYFIGFCIASAVGCAVVHVHGFGK